MTRHLLLAAIGLLTAAPAFADDMPTRKPGLWEMKMGLGGSGGSGPVVQQCTDAATDKALHSSAGAVGQQDCSKREIKKTAGGMTIDSVCTIAGKTITSHMEITGSFDSDYTMKINSDAAGQVAVVMQAKWLGPCKADQKPGDMIMPGGMKINVQNLRIPGGLPGAR